MVAETLLFPVVSVLVLNQKGGWSQGSPHVTCRGAHPMAARNSFSRLYNTTKMEI